ncbi:MAG: hypothetical protein KJ737_14935 [Proteobacteria bacterium]|nr:hypothetical protein [Pseudomonadota bacterium]
MLTPEIKFVIFQLVIVVPFFSGFFLKQVMLRLKDVSRKMVTLNLAMIEPPIVLWSIWGLALSSEMIVLPFFGLLIVVAGFIFGRCAAPSLHFSKKGSKTFIISSSLANHGFTMGGFLCYLVSGEKGLALSSIFLVYFIPFTFLFIFSYAGFDKKRKWAANDIRDFILTVRNMPLLAVMGALLIKSMHIRRPDIFFPMDTFLIVSVALYYFTLGINFEPADLKPFKKEHVMLAVEKFIFIPCVVFLFLCISALSQDVKQVIMIQSFMPAAIYSVVTSIIFDLDSRLASSLFVLNSLVFILIVLPIFALVGRSLF